MKIPPAAWTFRPSARVRHRQAQVLGRVLVGQLHRFGQVGGQHGAAAVFQRGRG